MKTVKYSIYILFIAIFLSVFFIPVTPVYAALDTIYVNGTTGSDDYDGSSPVHVSDLIGPKKTIYSGISAVADDGTVFVAAGIYYEHNLRLSKTMNLHGDGALSTIIDSEHKGNALEVSSLPDQRNTISGFTIRNGSPSGSDAGGGIYITETHILTINDCAIINNSKGEGSPGPNLGGGIYNEGGVLYMNRCTVSGNTAGLSGGGIYTDRTFGGDSGLIQLTNCTISGNTVTGDSGSGGGICGNNNSNMIFTNVTIADNRATGSASYGGGFANISGLLGDPISSCDFKNTIVSGNTAGDGISNNGYDHFEGGGIHSLGHNIDSENSCYFTDATDQINTDPLLGTLQNNGGQTSTQSITAGSPAYNRGTADGAPTTDQRGVDRPQNTYFDIGAFELINAVNTATGTGIATFTADSGSFTSLIASASTDCPAKTDISFPHGFFFFNIAGITTGSTVIITITLPSAMPPTAEYWKCIDSHWVNVTSLLGDNDGDNILTLTITDGGPGDADGLANGYIVDPGAPGIPQEPEAGIVPSHQSSESPQLPEQIILSPANLSIKYLNVQPQQARINQPVFIYASVANSGEEAGNYVATLKINGKIEETKTGTVGGMAAVPLKFEINKAQPGTYNVDINGRQTGFVIVADNSTDTIKTVPLVIFLVGAAVIIVLITLLILRRRDV